jgi:hypothetical protein
MAHLALAQASAERPRDNSAGHLVKACWSVTATSTAPGDAAALGSLVGLSGNLGR